MKDSIVKQGSNEELPIRAMLKSELAKYFGASMTSFRRAIKPFKNKLRKMGVTDNAKLLPPKAVAFLCQQLCISLYKNEFD
ncbi:MAG: hypothetical protein J6Y82_03920 [Bacteroidales bacterium]|nr:hypothetical protein [Bacteroidales bacterium]